jgi:hypothetical protein
MSWYTWVWGVATTLSVVVWSVVGFILAWDAVERRRERRAWGDPERTIAILRDKLEQRDEQIESYKQRLKEAQRGSSPWGQITP